jgi:hypothetical protein
VRSQFESSPNRGRVSIMNFLSVLAVCALATTALAVEPRETMCVKQKDGTYRCKASGKIEKKPCCDTPSNNPTPRPRK